MPQQVEIVEEFTRFASFDDDDSPDGIELKLAASDASGEPVKITGSVRVELYSFLQASGNRAGRRLCEPWSIALESEKDQETYWNRLTGMYEIPLAVPPEVTLNHPKYVLEVIYQTPFSTRQFDECILELPIHWRRVSGG